MLNAANEVAVAALLAGRIRYADIPRVIEECLTALPIGPVTDLETALGVDSQTRRQATDLVDQLVAAAE